MGGSVGVKYPSAVELLIVGLSFIVFFVENTRPAERFKTRGMPRHDFVHTLARRIIPLPPPPLAIAATFFDNHARRPFLLL